MKVTARMRTSYDVCIALPPIPLHYLRPQLLTVARVAERLTEWGIPTCLVTVREDQEQLLSTEGVCCFNAERIGRQLEELAAPTESVTSLEQRYSINLRKLILPEMLQRSQGDPRSYRREGEYIARLARFLAAFEDILEKTGAQHVFLDIGPYVIFRAAYRVARRRGIQPFVISASPFSDKGILFFTDELLTPESLVGPADSVSEADTALVRERVNQIVSRAEIPVYVSPFRLNSARVRGYVRNVLIRGFDNDLGRSGTILKTAAKLAKMHYVKRLYTRPQPSEQYVFFPLHHWLDTQLVLRAEPYIAQEFLVEIIARNLPQGYMLYVKEHPNCMGLYPGSLFQRIKALPNVRLIPALLNPHQLIAGAKLVCVINSTTGLEALMHGKSVVVFGNPYYSNAEGVFRVDNLYETGEIIAQALGYRPDFDSIITFLAHLYKSSYAARYFGIREVVEDNVDQLAWAMKDVMSRSKRVPAESQTQGGRM